MKLTPWLVLLSISLVSCSGSKSAQKVDEETPTIELSDADEFLDSTSDDTASMESSEFIEDTAEVTENIEPNFDTIVADAEPLIQETYVT